MRDDISMEVNLACDKTTLFVGAEIKGDRTVTNATGRDAYLVDCFQIILYSNLKSNFWFTVGADSEGNICPRSHYVNPDDIAWGNDMTGKNRKKHPAAALSRSLTILPKMTISLIRCL